MRFWDVLWTYRPRRSLLAAMILGLAAVGCATGDPDGPTGESAVPAPSAPAADARDIIRAGDRALAGGEREVAQSHYLRALSVAKNTKDVASSGLANLRLAAVNSMQRNFARAQDHGNKALGAATQLNDHNLMAASHGQLGRIHVARRNLKRAMTHFKAAHDEYQQLGNRSGAARTLSDVGMLALRARRPDQAMRALDVALRLAEGERNVHLIASIQARMGLASYMSGDYRGSINHYRIAARVQDRLKNKAVSAKNYRGMAASYFKLGNKSSACGAWSTARARYRNGHQPESAARMRIMMERSGC